MLYRAIVGCLPVRLVSNVLLSWHPSGPERSRFAAVVAVALLSVPSVASSQVTAHIPGFALVNQFSIPVGIPANLGDVMFVDRGDTLLILGGAESPSGGVWSLPVTRDSGGTVIALGPPTEVFLLSRIINSMEFIPGTDTLIFRDDFGVGERLSDGTVVEIPVSGVSFTGGQVIVPPSLPNGGDLLIANWPAGSIYTHTLTGNLDGTFTPTGRAFYSNSESGAGVDMEFICGGDFKDDLLFANWSQGHVSIMDIDPSTGQPVGGSTTPSITAFAGGLGVGPMGLGFDPITGNLFIVNWRGSPSNEIFQISGFPQCPGFCGDGILQLSTGEECDDGTGNSDTVPDACRTTCVFPFCGDNVVDSAEMCDPPMPSAEICNDLIDNDGDGFVDCEDQDCPAVCDFDGVTPCVTNRDCRKIQSGSACMGVKTCGAGCEPVSACNAVGKDPSLIRFGKSGKLDFFRMHASFSPQQPTDANLVPFGIRLSNANGVIFDAQLAPGTLRRRGGGFSLTDKAARVGAGTHDGLFRVSVRSKTLKGKFVYAFRVKAYGDYSAATLARMTMQVVIGSDSVLVASDWRQTKRGWKLTQSDLDR